MIVYVNGDSFPYMSDGKRYSDYLSEAFNCESVNSSIGGSCNSRIIRTTLRDLIELKKKDPDILAVISMSFTIRTELWDEETQAGYWKQCNDGGFASYSFAVGTHWFTDGIITNKGIPATMQAYAKQWLINFDIEAETTNLLSQCLLLTNWLKSNNIKYVLLSSCLQEPIDFNAPFVKPFYTELFADPRVINFYNFSFTEYVLSKGHTPIDVGVQEIHGKKYNTGHHGDLAHKEFANYLIENYFNEI